MKTTTTLSLVFLAAFICTVSSCKRQENVQTVLTRLQHTWKLMKIATDDNGNGSIDGFEIHPLNNGADDRITFDKDYTGKQVVTSPNGVVNEYAFTWALDSKDTVIRNGVGNNLIKYHIKNISTDNLQLITVTDKNILASYYYDRQ